MLKKRNFVQGIFIMTFLGGILGTYVFFQIGNCNMIWGLRCQWFDNRQADSNNRLDENFDRISSQTNYNFEYQQAWEAVQRDIERRKNNVLRMPKEQEISLDRASDMAQNLKKQTRVEE